MKAKALGRVLTAGLLSSVVVFVSITGNAQIPTPTPDWVNIKDPKFGAFGDGSHDDTAAIQAAIDYAFAHNLAAVYCPNGNYKTTSTIYVDPPGNLRTNLANPTQFQFSMAFFGDPTGSVPIPGCQLKPTFNDDIALLMGPGQGMRVSDIGVIGPNSGPSTYRGMLPAGGVGIGFSGGSGGSSINLADNTYVANFYDLYKTDANNGCCLNDSNTFRKVVGSNGYRGIFLYGTQSFVNDVVEPRISSTTIMIDGEWSHQLNVFGGNLSASSGQSNSFEITSTSTLFTRLPCTGGGAGRCFTTVVGTPGIPPDNYFGNTAVYNSYMINTAHFGVIPLTLISWDSTTNTATFGVWLPWLFNNYGYSGIPSFAMQSDIQGATALYAAERVEVARGMGITLDGIHIENPLACSSLFTATNVWTGQASNTIKDPFINYDPSGVSTGTTQAQKYCQQSFPFIDNRVGSLRIQGGNFYTAVNPLIIDQAFDAQITGSLLSGVAFNVRVWDQNGCSYGQLGDTGTGPGCRNTGTIFESVARGAGRWDNDYFFPIALNFDSELTTDYCGYEPCPWATPNLSPTLYALVSGTLGPLGTYPPIACRTVFKSVDWNTSAVTPPSTEGGGIFKRSASCPGYSWGQNLTSALVGGTLTWSYMAGSDVLYLDANTIKWMFPGLGISLNSGSGGQPYIVTGVYPYLGYVTVIWAGSNSGGPLQGAAGTVYSCSSSCTIGQAPFLWTAY